MYKASESIAQPVLPQINLLMGKRPECLFQQSKNYAETGLFHQNTSETRRMSVPPKMNVLERHQSLPLKQ
ncbi:hypothetical protein [Microcoleus sp. Pol12B4]|uniref:hypothetical protein n=1 Tax=Microcoleus sp. Pol12B4 TaxID=3055395 RepID=UPI002FD1D239